MAPQCERFRQCSVLPSRRQRHRCSTWPRVTLLQDLFPCQRMWSQAHLLFLIRRRSHLCRHVAAEVAADADDHLADRWFTNNIITLLLLFKVPIPATPLLTVAWTLNKINTDNVARLALTVWLSISRDSARISVRLMTDGKDEIVLRQEY